MSTNKILTNLFFGSSKLYECSITLLNVPVDKD